MKAGLLELPLPVRPLERIFPSRFKDLLECPLRETWVAAREPELLPPSPVGRVGSIIHRLLEEAGKGRFQAGDRAALERRWDELVQQFEAGMAKCSLQRHLVPLGGSVFDLQVRRLRALRRAEEIAAVARPVTTLHAPTAPPATERWVQAVGGLVGGSIDRVVQSPEGPVLRDYKSGAILAEEAGGQEGVRAPYRAQLQLYAALYAAETGRWPVRLEIVPLDGPAREVPFDPAGCTALLEQARASLERINERIMRGTGDAERLQRELASPQPSACCRCGYRPACGAYKLARQQAPLHGDWPCDLWGSVRELRRLGNGKVLLGVQAPDAGTEIVYVRGVNPSPERHPALEQIAPGVAVALFNLAPPASAGGALAETARTALYVLPPA